MKIFNSKGVAHIEFILIISVFITLSFSGYEIYRVMSIKNYLQESAYKIALWASKKSDSHDLQTYMNIIISEGATYNMQTNGTVIISLVSAGGTLNNNIYRQQKVGRDNSNVSISFPVLYNNDVNSPAIDSAVVELFYNHSFMFLPISPQKLSYAVCMDLR